MNQTPEAEPTLFEAWAKTCDGNCNARDLLKWDPKHKHAPEGVTYHSALVERDWIVWQAARAIPQAAAEPVAWYVTDPDGSREYNTINEFSGGRSNGIPLYAAPDRAPRIDSAADAKDAARYRWLRVLGNHFGLMSSMRWTASAQLDAAIDQAIAAMKGEDAAPNEN